MLNLNCVRGMKVTTTGNPIGMLRNNSGTIDGEEIEGFLILVDSYGKNNYRQTFYVKSKSNSIDFYAEQIHPYFGGKK